MRSSSVLRTGNLGLVAYPAAALLAAAELLILWLALNPDVHPDYREFYIDRTTTCLNRPLAGTYELGETVSFRPDGAKKSQELKVCGWTDPAGDGSHSLGEMSRLRIAVDRAEFPGDLLLSLELAPVLRPDAPRQDVLVSVNGTTLHRAVLTSPEPRMVSVRIPRHVIGTAGPLEIRLDYPMSLSTGWLASNTRDRAVKLSSLTLAPAVEAEEWVSRGNGGSDALAGSTPWDPSVSASSRLFPPADPPLSRR